MKKWIAFFLPWSVCLWMSFAAGCAPGIKNKDVLCRVRFDTDDPALVQMSEQNLRALAAFEAACGRFNLR